MSRFTRPASYQVKFVMKLLLYIKGKKSQAEQAVGLAVRAETVVGDGSRVATALATAKELDSDSDRR